MIPIEELMKIIEEYKNNILTKEETENTITEIIRTFVNENF